MQFCRSRRLRKKSFDISETAFTSGVFLFTFIISCALFVFAKYLPWRVMSLLTVWAAFLSGHPSLKGVIASVWAQVAPKERAAAEKVDWFAHRDITLSAVAETREVEIFELQRLTSAGEYEPWVFSPSAYEPLSPGRISDERPQGTRFFEDVRCPHGWEWDEGKWTLDLGSLVWVKERYINGVEVEEEGERWVYDWEGEERGAWRRRRWVRVCRRKYQGDPQVIGD